MGVSGVEDFAAEVACNLNREFTTLVLNYTYRVSAVGYLSDRLEVKLCPGLDRRSQAIRDRQSGPVRPWSSPPLGGGESGISQDWGIWPFVPTLSFRSFYIRSWSSVVTQPSATQPKDWRVMNPAQGRGAQVPLIPPLWAEPIWVWEITSSSLEIQSKQ